jgi:hypothetical protein
MWLRITDSAFVEFDGQNPEVSRHSRDPTSSLTKHHV